MFLNSTLVHPCAAVMMTHSLLFIILKTYLWYNIILYYVVLSGPEGDEIEISEDLKKAGYPQESRHSFVTLRQELVDAFVEYVNISLCIITEYCIYLIAIHCPILPTHLFIFSKCRKKDAFQHKFYFRYFLSIIYEHESIIGPTTLAFVPVTQISRHPPPFPTRSRWRITKMTRLMNTTLIYLTVWDTWDLWEQQLCY